MQTLIIGGTGMLAALAYELTIESDTVTMVAKTEASLSKFKLRLDVPKQNKCTLIAADWNNQHGYIDILKQNIVAAGSPDLVIAWLHDSQFINKIIAATGKRHTIFVHVCGSRTPNMTEAIDAQYSKIDYRQVILGYQVEPGGKRWLTDQEICAGVKSAITNPSPLTLVGLVDS